MPSQIIFDLPRVGANITACDWKQWQVRQFSNALYFRIKSVLFWEKEARDNTHLRSRFCPLQELHATE